MNLYKFLGITVFVLIFACENSKDKKEVVEYDLAVKESLNIIPNTTSLIVLGTIQDAGSPHMGCYKLCCKDLFSNPDPSRKVVSLGVVDPENNLKYIFEATPDFNTQTKILKSYLPSNKSEVPDGVFLSHAHIGHYTGLQYLGKEAMGASNVPVYAMPRMKNFLETNGPWSQLVSMNNILINAVENKDTIVLSSNLKVVPFTVPHRDEYSETVGFTIIGPSKKVLFIPDIDKWDKWEEDIITEIAKVDYAFIDATFYSGEELNNRDISQIPHPFIIESMKSFEVMESLNRSKVQFIHFNHTNPVLQESTGIAKEIESKGFNVALIDDVIIL
jgi:pyrroloquinoline quinone biosynthesis protein B